MTAIVYQFSIPGMAGRKPSSPARYIAELIERTKAARVTSGLSREAVIEALSRRVGRSVSLAKYKKWETRTPIPHEFIIPFCEATGLNDPWFLLTGSPFQIGRSPHAEIAPQLRLPKTGT